MGATQVDIARKLRLDVSSVNKILNATPGQKFKKKTRELVLRTARKMGYNFERGSKGKLRQILFELFPAEEDAEVLAVARGVSPEKVREIRSYLKFKGAKP